MKMLSQIWRGHSRNIIIIKANTLKFCVENEHWRIISNFTGLTQMYLLTEMILSQTLYSCKWRHSQRGGCIQWHLSGIIISAVISWFNENYHLSKMSLILSTLHCQTKRIFYLITLVSAFENRTQLVFCGGECIVFSASIMVSFFQFLNLIATSFSGFFVIFNITMKRRTYAD